MSIGLFFSKNILNLSMLKIIIRKDRINPQGVCPIALRITLHRESSYIYLESKVDPTSWLADKQLVDPDHQNALETNAEIHDILKEAEFAYETLKRSSDFITVQEIRNLVVRRNKPVSFYEFAELRLAHQEKTNRISSWKSDKSRIANIRLFHKGLLDFRKITPKFLEDLDTFLLTERKMKAKRSRDNHRILIRTLFNKAIRDGHVDPKHYPFSKGKIEIIIMPTLKVGLTVEEVVKIENLELESGSRLDNARNAWLFSFYNAGIRVKDLVCMTWRHVQDGSLGYTMSKNDKIGVHEIHPKALSILNNYKKPDQQLDDYIFPFIPNLQKLSKRSLNSHISTITSTLNSNLKKIGQIAGISKKITNHTARHTFGNIAMDKIGLRSLQKLFRHTSAKTTELYQGNFHTKKVDDDLNKVLDY
jgi:integrase/recombinase XerD